MCFLEHGIYQFLITMLIITFTNEKINNFYPADRINFSYLLFHRRRNTETEEGHASFSHKAGFMG